MYSSNIYVYIKNVLNFPNKQKKSKKMQKLENPKATHVIESLLIITVIAF